MAIVCGILKGYRRGAFRKTLGFSWPLGRLDVKDEELVGCTPIFFGRGAIRIKFDEMEEAVVKDGLFRAGKGGTVSLRLKGDHRDEVVIYTVSDGYREVLRALRDHLITIRPE